ncbi:MAG: acetyl-CoA synthetase [Acidimicrobiia bacterium]
MSVDPRTPCLIGVGRRTWHPEDVGEEGAPEPLAMWETVARAAAADAAPSGAGRVLGRLDSVQLVYCQSWPYDAPVERLVERIGCAPRHRWYSGIGGTTPQVLVQETAAAILHGELDCALIGGAEALATVKRVKAAGERPAWSFRDPEKKPFPFEAPFHPAEVAHEVFQAWLTFAVFDNARRAARGLALDEHRTRLGVLWERCNAVAVANPEAWFRVARTASEIATPTATNRMVGYPYTKYMVSVMDVDMAAAVVVASHETADALGVPPERRVYLRGWCYATDPVYVAEHDDMARSPAMELASREALRRAGAAVDDVAHFDLYSCFASSVNFARDALGLRDGDTRPVTVTGGLPYHGGPGSNYLTHSIAAMAEVLRADPGSLGMVSGVGMHMTKHVFGVYSTSPGPVLPPDQRSVQAALDAGGHRSIVDSYAGDATVVAYSVVHGRDGSPEWGLLVLDLSDGSRTYAKALDPSLLDDAERTELVGRRVCLATDGRVNTVVG